MSGIISAGVAPFNLGKFFDACCRRTHHYMAEDRLNYFYLINLTSIILLIPILCTSTSMCNVCVRPSVASREAALVTEIFPTIYTQKEIFRELEFFQLRPQAGLTSASSMKCLLNGGTDASSLTQSQCAA